MKLKWVIVALTFCGVITLSLFAVFDRQRLHGFLSPVFSADGTFIYFIERHTHGLHWGLGIEHFTPPAHAYILQDRLALKRIKLDSGSPETLVVWPTSPLVGKHLRFYRNRIFGVLSARLQFEDNGELGYTLSLSLPRMPISETFYIEGWVHPEKKPPAPPVWRRRYAVRYGHLRYRLHGEWEVMAAPGKAAFPSAIIRYRYTDNTVRVVLANDIYNALHPNGIALKWLTAHAQRSAIERLNKRQALYQNLLQHFATQGLPDGEARLRTHDEMVRLGYAPTPTQLRADPVRHTDDELPVFEITETEFVVGLFSDIWRAIATPGALVEKNMGSYIRHRDFDTSARLNAYLKTGAGQFYVKYGERLFKLTIVPLQPARR
jgi:hypothetical protein